MPLEIPKLDNRTYQEILDEALARIPVHNPEWTNFNDSDPGITLLQLFAFMTDNLLYRANLIPERNRIKFLQLLGVPMQPAGTAEGFISFINARGPLKTITLDAGLEVSSGQVPFCTRNGLDVLPIEGQVYFKGKPTLSETEYQDAEKLYKQLYASLDKPGAKLSLYETRRLLEPSNSLDRPVVNLTADTVDHCLWLAIMARRPKDVKAARKEVANKVLTLGIMPSVEEDKRVLRPTGVLTEESQAELIFEIPDVIEEPQPGKDDRVVAKYKYLPASTSSNLLWEPGLVQLKLPGEKSLDLWKNLEPTELGVGNLPPSLEDQDVKNRVITWIRIRRQMSAEEENKLSTEISWVGVNSVMISQRLPVFAENLGRGTGEPDQSVTLVNTPVIPESLTLMVNGETWREIDDLAAADPEVPRQNGSTSVSQFPKIRKVPIDQVKVYTLDPESGEIHFGDGLRGKRPPTGAVIQASYDYGGGNQGQVGVGVIKKAPALPAGLQVTNPLPTWGGNEEETVSEAEKRISSFLRHRNRLVSKEDFQELTLQTPGVDIGRVEVIPVFHPEMIDIPSPGVVTVMVIPRYDLSQPDAPMPDRWFLDAVCKYLHPRRLVTTEVHVRGPKYVSIWVTVGIEVIAGKDFAPLREKVIKELQTFLSPLTGGYEKTGWLLSRGVDAEELKAVATRVEGVAKVNGLLLGKDSGEHQANIPLEGLELPRLTGISVQLGNPQDLDALRKGVSDLPGEQVDLEIVPIPITPPECTVE